MNAPCGVLLSLLAGFGQSASAQPAADSGGGWRTTELNLDITVLPAAGQLQLAGTLELELTLPTSNGPTLGMNYRNAVMRFVSVDPQTPAEVALNATIEPMPEARLAHIRLPEPAVEGDTLTVRFAAESEGDSFQFKVNEQAALASWTEGWYPFPAPAPGEDVDATLVTAPGTKTFHLPPGWRAVSNGELVHREETETGVTETWRADNALAHSFIAAPFQAAVHDVDGRQVGVYLLGDHPTGATEQASALAAALAAMESRLGPYPYPTYAIAEVPEQLVDWYASSEQGFVMARASAFGYPGGNLALFAHEMAHGWWGNRVPTTGEGSIMVSEALAQYSAVVAIEEVEGPAAATEFLRFSREGYNRMQSAWGVFEMWRDDKSKPLSQLESGGWQHNLADAKGHWVYHMLRRRVGDEIFFGTLRQLIETHAGNPMSLDDLRAAFVANAPDTSLEAFFAQWLDRAGAPIIDLDWWMERDEEQRSLVVTLTQRTKPYQLSVELAVDHPDGSQRHRVELIERVTRFVLPDPPEVSHVRLDPDHELLLWTPQYGAPPKVDAP